MFMLNIFSYKPETQADYAINKSQTPLYTNIIANTLSLGLS